MFSSNTTQVGISGTANYIEDVFSTYIYTGTGATQNINNGIDLSGSGGLVWIKNRNNYYGHALVDTTRGSNQVLFTNSIGEQTTYGSTVSAFNSNGFTLGSAAIVNDSTAGYERYVSCTFRKQLKFFDVVTYTGDGSAGRTIVHNLGSTPGCMIVKRTDATNDWAVYHISTTGTKFLNLNTTAAVQTSSSYWNNADPASTYFTVGSSLNVSSGTYIAYLFAHNAGGFGITNTDNVISCGTFTTNASGNATIELGYEPQFVITKRITSSGNWRMLDTMRGWSQTYQNVLYPNINNLEGESTQTTDYPYENGFSVKEQNSVDSYIYIAIRRGPMKTPTAGTSVFSTILANNAQGTQNTTNFPVDMQLAKYTGSSPSLGTYVADRLRGVSTTSTTGGQHLITSSTAAEVSTNATQFWNNTGFQTSSGWANTSMVYWNFRRAPSFFDVVSYTGNGNSENALNHSLGIPPELVIVKARSRVSDGDTTWSGWWVKVKGAGNTARVFGTPHPYPTGSSGLHSTGSGGAASYLLGGSLFTNTIFKPYYVTEAGGDLGLAGNMTGEKYVAYLFATCPGVSKVGTYTGTSNPQTIDCGFTGGARFVMLKCTSLNSTNWVVFDSVRGIVSGIDPFLYLNSTIGQQSTLDLVAPQSIGFGFGSESYYGEINQSGQSYMFLAIA
jgi:hypothetical protein